MSSSTIDRIAGLLGALLVSTFVLGLAESISAGAAGFWGGLPFWIICLTVLPLTFYAYWDGCFREKQRNPDHDAD